MTGSLFKGNFWVSPRGGRQISGLGTRRGRRPARGRAAGKRTGPPGPPRSGTVRGAACLGRLGTQLALEVLVPLLRVRTRADTRPRLSFCRGPQPAARRQVFGSRPWVLFCRPCPQQLVLPRTGIARDPTEWGHPSLISQLRKLRPKGRSGSTVESSRWPRSLRRRRIWGHLG